MRKHTVITIDGPAGSGKSSTARLLAKRLGFTYLDTGAMYRSVTLAAIEKRIDLNDEASVADIAGKVKIEIVPGENEDRFFLGSKETTELMPEFRWYRPIRGLEKEWLSFSGNSPGRPI
jgi:cytidylate kinase